MSGHPTIVQRAEMCSIPVMLNDRPARVAGYRNDFASVVDLDTGLSAEWAWATVERIVGNGGRFYT